MKKSTDFEKSFLVTTKNVTVFGIALMAKTKLDVENVKKLKLHVREDYFMKIQNVYQCRMFVTA